MELTLLHPDMFGDEIKDDLFSWAICNAESDCIAVTYGRSMQEAKDNAAELSKGYSRYIMYAAKQEAEEVCKKSHDLLKLSYDKLKEDNNKLAKDNNMLMSKLSECDHKFVFLKDDSFYTRTRFTISYFKFEVFFCEKCLEQREKKQSAIDVSIYDNAPEWAVNTASWKEKK